MIRNVIEWEKSNEVLCSQCGKLLTIPYAHIHFHYGTEGLSEAAREQLRKYAGLGYGDDVGFLGRDMCMDCFRELLSLVAEWRGAGGKSER